MHFVKKDDFHNEFLSNSKDFKRVANVIKNKHLLTFLWAFSLGRKIHSSISPQQMFYSFIYFCFFYFTSNKRWRRWAIFRDLFHLPYWTVEMASNIRVKASRGNILISSPFKHVSKVFFLF